MDQAIKDYQRLHKISREARVLGGIASLLDWDHETYMPKGSVGIRSEQLKLLAGMIHAKRIGKPFAKALGKLIDIESGQILAPSLEAEQQAALREWRRDYLKEKALPKRFVEEWAKLTSQSIMVWREARERDAFQHFAPFLDRIVSMSRKKAEYLGFKYSPYDALLDLYEPNVTAQELKTLFDHLRMAITQLMEKILPVQQVDDSLLSGSFSNDKQMALGRLILETMQYDMNKGRLDLSAHPFSSASHPTDSRITTRIHPTSLVNNISTVLHEAGHALYEMGLPVEKYGSPLGESISLGVHESQSRFWETRIGQSKPFCQYLLPLLKKHFHELDSLSIDMFYKAINKVTPSLIRVDADEVTYNLHVILRFEMELGLIEGTIRIRDVPEIWNAKMHELLGITPSSNRDGCLQDIHWSMGGFGYFPSYTLGNLYASHLFLGFQRDYPDWQAKVSSGNLGFIKEWLGGAVYQHGRRFTSKELLQNIVGQPFTANAFIDYINNKYTALFVG